jgi:hypothetical protein
MLELAFAASSRQGRRSARLPEPARKQALLVWAEMEADQITPSSNMCHKMFTVYGRRARTLLTHPLPCSPARWSAPSDAHLRCS